MGKVAYWLELTEKLSQIHDTVHVSQLRKCITDETAAVRLKYIQVDNDMNYVVIPVAILDMKVTTLMSQVVIQFKVQWQYHNDSEQMWEPEVEMLENYPVLFPETDFEGKV